MAPPEPTAAWTIADHFGCGQEMQRVYFAMDYLADEVLEKKMHRDHNGQRVMRAACFEPFYMRTIFHERKQRTSLDPFPCCFQGLMDHAVHHEHADADEDLRGVYYTNVKVPRAYRDRHAWYRATMGQMSGEAHATLHDRRMVRRVNQETLDVMRRCIEKGATAYAPGSHAGLARLLALQDAHDHIERSSRDYWLRVALWVRVHVFLSRWAADAREAAYAPDGAGAKRARLSFEQEREGL